jgi:hypothetical protein
MEVLMQTVRAGFVGFISLLYFAQLVVAANPSEEIAKSWLGHDASALLMQWPVDSGYRAFEVDATGETGYSWDFGRNESSYTDYWQSASPAGPGIVAVEQHSEKVVVPRQYHCGVTFYANADGIISRYEYGGPQCNPYFREWGRPKKK